MYRRCVIRSCDGRAADQQLSQRACGSSLPHRRLRALPVRWQRDQVRQRSFLRHFILKTIILPRQARDKTQRKETRDDHTEKILPFDFS